jgi:hypothetical protein
MKKRFRSITFVVGCAAAIYVATLIGCILRMDPIHSALIRFMYDVNTVVCRVLPSPSWGSHGEWSTVGGGHGGSGSITINGVKVAPNWDDLFNAPFYPVFDDQFLDSYYAFFGPLAMFTASLCIYLMVLVVVKVAAPRLGRARVELRGRADAGIAILAALLPVAFTAFVLVRLLRTEDAMGLSGYVSVVGMSRLGLVGIEAAAVCTLVCAALGLAGPSARSAAGVCAGCGYGMDTLDVCPECGRTRAHQSPVIRVRWLAVVCGLLWISPIWLSWVWLMF